MSTCLALSANFRVLTVSSMFWMEGDIVATIYVIVFPIKLSCKILVNFDSLKGIGNLLLLLKLWITFPKLIPHKKILNYKINLVYCTED